MDTCDKCKFINELEDGNTGCFRYPPTVKVVQVSNPLSPSQVSMQQMVSIPPVVPERAACGEFVLNEDVDFCGRA